MGDQDMPALTKEAITPQMIEDAREIFRKAFPEANEATSRAEVEQFCRSILFVALSQDSRERLAR